jgi:hypothetical protein
MTSPDALITLNEAAKLIAGADANTLKRMHREGKLTVYRPGRAFVTTYADVMEAVTNRCRVAPKVRVSGSVPRVETPPASPRMNPLGLSSTELASIALDSIGASEAEKDEASNTCSTELTWVHGKGSFEASVRT